MIGNNILENLYRTVDEDTAINQILDYLKSVDEDFIESIKIPIDIDLCTQDEVVFLTKVSALIDYFLQIKGIEVPSWVRDNRLSFSKPYYHSKRISDFEKIRVQYTSPAPLHIRNVFFDLDGLKRV